MKRLEELDLRPGEWFKLSDKDWDERRPLSVRETTPNQPLLVHHIDSDGDIWVDLFHTSGDERTVCIGKTRLGERHGGKSSMWDEYL